MTSVFTAGSIISNYRLERMIGSGGFGEVWLAEHTDLGSRVAIKIPTLIEYVRQLRAEGRIQHDLSHPNIVRILDLNTSHNPPYCVMEYVAGENLRQKIAREILLPPAQALAIMRQILVALHEAHSQGIVHCDLKPENILLDSQSVARITDFGLGAVCDTVTRSIIHTSSRNPVSSHTMDSGAGAAADGNGQSSGRRSDSIAMAPLAPVIGTYDYMSPEQRTGECIDARSDIYAAGVILCEMLTGERPEVGVESQLRRQHIDKYISEAILAALDEYQYRFASSLDFLRALRLDSALFRTTQKSPSPGINDLARSDSPLDEFLRSLGYRLKIIEGGSFVMGSEDGPDNERPAAVREVRPFHMAIYPVTAQEYCLFLNVEGDSRGTYAREGRQSTFRRAGSGFFPITGCEEYPVNCVSWKGAAAYCEWLSRIAGFEFALPTEEQWEYVARAGAAQLEYPTGTRTPTPDEACFGRQWSSARETLRPVSCYAPNAFGVFGMAGNVWQWCRDPFLGNYAKTQQIIQSMPPSAQMPSTYSVARGGCWSSPPEELRCAFRNVQLKGVMASRIGFRICRTI